jgi:propanediol dehydratase small subunit
MPVPPLDGAARSDALRKAAEARRARADLKRDLKDGRLDLRAVLERAGGSTAVANMRVVEVLAALPRFGPTRAAALMDVVGIAPSRRVRGLGVRQRTALLAALDA